MKRADCCSLLVIACVLGVELSIVHSLSVTYDEVIHIGTGVRLVEKGERRLDPQPPLVALAAGASAHALGVREGPAAARAYPPEGVPEAERFKLQLPFGENLIAHDNARFQLPYALPGADSVVEAARLPCVLGPLAVLVLGWLWSRARFGPSGGLVTVLLLATYPDLLGHGALVKNDVPFAAFALGAGFLLDGLLERGGALRAVFLGVVLGLAFATKASATFLLLGLGASVLVARPPRTRALPLLVAGTVALVVLGVFYGGRFGAYLADATSVYAGRGHAQGVCLDRYAERFPHYFLVALALKLPGGTLVLLAASAFLTRPTRRDAPLLVTPLLYLASLSIVAAPLGSRYVIPVVVFLLVSAGRLGAWARSSHPRWMPIAILLAGNAAFCAASHPFEASFTNGLAGSPRTFYKLLDDSNQDWGGGWKAFATWRRAHPGPLTVVVHATSFAARNLASYDVKADVRLGDVLSAPEKGRIYAVSADVVSKMRLRARERGGRLALGDDLEPDEVVGGGILIFRP